MKKRGDKRIPAQCDCQSKAMWISSILVAVMLVFLASHIDKVVRLIWQPACRSDPISE